MAVKLRRQQTDVERQLWFALRRRRMSGAKFRRQVPIGPYIVDFLCPKAGLVVELDGGQHGGPADDLRDEVASNLDGVLIALAKALPI